MNTIVSNCDSKSMSSASLLRDKQDAEETRAVLVRLIEGGRAKGADVEDFVLALREVE